MMVTELSIDPRIALAEDIAKFYSDPLGFVLYCWPWGKPGLLEHHSGPDKWQAEFLRRLGEEVKLRKFDGHTPVAPCPHGRGQWAWNGKKRFVCLGDAMDYGDTSKLPRRNNRFDLPAAEYQDMGNTQSMASHEPDRRLV